MAASGPGRTAHRGRGAGRRARAPRPPRSLTAARRDYRRFGILLGVFLVGFVVCTLNAYAGVRPTPLWLTGFFVYMILALYALGQWLSALRAVGVASGALTRGGPTGPGDAAASRPTADAGVGGRQDSSGS